MRHLLPILFLLFIDHSFSQRLYIGLSGGYQQVLNQEQPPSYMINSHHGITCPGFWKRQEPSFEHILSTGLNVGYEFNEKVGLEISGSYLKLTSTLQESSYVRKIFKGNFWRITPSFVLRAPTEKIDLYAKIGLSVVGGKILYGLRYEGEYVAYSFEEIMLDYEFTGPASFGFKTAFGGSKKIADFLEVFTEIEFIYQNFSPLKGYTKRYEVDGQDQLELYDYPRRDTEIEFGDEQAFSGYQIKDDNVPERLYRRTFSLSGFALSIGVRFNLFQKVEKQE